MGLFKLGGEVGENEIFSLKMFYWGGRGMEWERAGGFL